MRFVPSVVILGIDLCVVFGATMLAIVFRESVIGITHTSTLFTPIIPISILAVRVVFFLLFHIHKIVVRYTNSKDVLKIFLTTLSGTIFLLLLSYTLWFLDIGEKRIIPDSTIGMEFFITTTLLVIYRFVFKIYFLSRVNPKKLKKNIVIVGAGASGITTKRALDRDTASKYNVLSFFFFFFKKKGMKLDTLTVRVLTQLDEYL
jgi:FlaA1/EpsC-like NDP-sugar epimerase